MMAAMSIGAGTDACAGCTTHPSRRPALVRPGGSGLGLGRSGGRRPWRGLKKVLVVAVLGCVGVVASLAAFAGVTLYRIDHAVHHVALSSALMAKGDKDLLTVVRGPEHHEEIYVFRTASGHTNVLQVPSSLGVRGAHGSSVPLSTLSLYDPSAIVKGLRQLGIPVGRYVGVDLHAVPPTSALGRLALGTTSITSLVSHPAGTASLMEAVASHVYLGPNTSPSSLMSLMQVPTTHTVSVPTSTKADGQVVLSAPAVDVLKHFL
jgi:hypothetical protein